MKVLRLAVVFSMVAGSAWALPKPAEWSQSDWEKFIEAGVQIGLGEALTNAGGVVPLVDVYSALSAFGGSTNAGLVLWLNRKQADAEIAGDHVRADRYQAFQTCLVSGDCRQIAAIDSANAGGVASLADLAGHWQSSIGFEYDIVRSGDGYHWTVSKGTPSETGEIAIKDGQLIATWKGTNGSGSVDGHVADVKGGSGVGIAWSNGVRFFR